MVWILYTTWSILYFIGANQIPEGDRKPQLCCQDHPEKIHYISMNDNNCAVQALKLHLQYCAMVTTISNIFAHISLSLPSHLLFLLFKERGGHLSSSPGIPTCANPHHIHFHSSYYLTGNFRNVILTWAISLLPESHNAERNNLLLKSLFPAHCRRGPTGVQGSCPETGNTLPQYIWLKYHLRNTTTGDSTGMHIDVILSRNSPLLKVRFFFFTIAIRFYEKALVSLHWWWQTGRRARAKPLNSE